MFGWFKRRKAAGKPVTVKVQPRSVPRVKPLHRVVPRSAFRESGDGDIASAAAFVALNSTPSLGACYGGDSYSSYDSGSSSSDGGSSADGGGSGCD